MMRAHCVCTDVCSSTDCDFVRGQRLFQRIDDRRFKHQGAKKKHSNIATRQVRVVAHQQQPRDPLQPDASGQESQRLHETKAPVTAGIPVSSELATATGQRLLDCIVSNVGEFVPLIGIELLQLKRPEGEDELDEPLRPLPADRVALARLQACREDIMYCWALAEAYCGDPTLRRDMRVMLNRDPETGELGDGREGRRLVTPVQFMPGAEGVYKLGSCLYTEPPPSQSASEQPFLHSPTEDGVVPALDPVMASAMGRHLLASEGSSPTRIDRDGAARTFSTYVSFGYFSRRMQLRRSLGLENSFRDSSTMSPDAPQEAPTSYGPTSAVWRVFENVPLELSDFRTPEAAAVADRHLRALFGDHGSECLTTLNAWHTMCEEARHWGRSLFDAESVVLAEHT